MLPALILALAALGIAAARLWSYRAQLLEMAQILEETPAESPKRADNGGNYRGFEWNFVCEGCRFGGESSGFRQGGQAGKWAEKVAEIEFFQDGNHAENGHLSTDKVTKCSGKVFALKKTATE